ncbi:MAG: hypothetical protein ABIA66_00230 [Candidatus Omnitrophota bacterium]
MFASSHPNNPHKPYTARWYARQMKYAFDGWKLRKRHSVGLKTWPTKCYEFWLILQQLLYLVEPKTIVEFGSGRSTNYIAEYIHKFGGNYISFEQHLYYYFKFNIALSFLFLPWGTVRYVPLKGDWYDAKVISKNLQGVANIDFLFYDGPVEMGKIRRDSKTFFRVITSFLKEVKIIVVDDVHRLHENAIAEKFKNAYHLKRYNLFSVCDNTRVAILLNEEAVKKVEFLPLFLQKLLEA